MNELELEVAHLLEENSRLRKELEEVTHTHVVVISVRE